MARIDAIVLEADGSLRVSRVKNGTAMCVSLMMSH